MQSLNGFVFSGYKVQQNRLGKYAIELEVDSNDAFDYENPDNAKYTVDQLKVLLQKEIVDI